MYFHGASLKVAGCDKILCLCPSSAGVRDDDWNLMMRVLGLLLVAIGVLMIRKPLSGERTLINKGVYRYDQINACPGNNAIISYGPAPIAFCFLVLSLSYHVNCFGSVKWPDAA